MDELSVRLSTASEYVLLSEVLKRINGFLLDIEGYTLYLLARLGAGEGAIVEIGSFEGKSTAWLALGSKQGSREMVYAVDTFQGSPEHQEGAEYESTTLKTEGTTFNAFQQNMKMIGMADRVTPIVASSTNAAAKWDGGPIRLLFIDGDHSYEACAADFHAWCEYVAPQGYITFHDYGHAPGVVKFCDELEAADNGLKKLFVVNSVCVFQREH